MGKKDHIYIKEYNSVIKKEWNLTICNNMDGPSEYYAKRNESEKDKHCINSFICEYKNQNKWTKTKTEAESLIQRENWWLPKEKMVGSWMKQVKGI